MGAIGIGLRRQVQRQGMFGQLLAGHEAHSRQLLDLCQQGIRHGDARGPRRTKVAAQIQGNGNQRAFRVHRRDLVAPDRLQARMRMARRINGRIIEREGGRQLHHLLAAGQAVDVGGKSASWKLASWTKPRSARAIQRPGGQLPRRRARALGRHAGDVPQNVAAGLEDPAIPGRPASRNSPGRRRGPRFRGRSPPARVSVRDGAARPCRGRRRSPARRAS